MQSSVHCAVPSVLNNPAPCPTCKRYGSYEVPNDPDFRSTRLSLIDRGFSFAIAHVRGGGGRAGGVLGSTGQYHAVPPLLNSAPSELNTTGPKKRSFSHSGGACPGSPGPRRGSTLALDWVALCFDWSSASPRPCSCWHTARVVRALRAVHAAQATAGDASMRASTLPPPGPPLS